MKRWLPLLLALCATLPEAAVAEAYKCRLPDGRVEFSDAACGNGGTISVRPDDTVTPAVRERAERDAQRQRQQADEMAARRAAQPNAPPAATAGSPSPPPEVVDACLAELGRQTQVVDEEGQRAKEAACRSTGDANTAAGYPSGYGGGIGQCIFNVEGQGLSPAATAAAIRACQGLPPLPTPTVAPTPAPTEPPAARTPVPAGTAQPLCGAGQNCGRRPVVTPQTRPAGRGSASP